MKNIYFKSVSLGCRVNQTEIERITQDLISRGFTLTLSLSRSLALVVINTCVVTQKAEKETRKEIRKQKRLHPNAFIVVLGCGVDNQEKFQGKLPEADLFISNIDKDRTVDLILKHFKSQDRNVTILQPSNILISKYQKSGKKLIKIQDGCNYQCSYCLVPSLRGKSKSVSVDNIINQINSLKDTQEIILTGINLSLYGLDLKPKISFLELLNNILKETKINKITLTSLDPQLVDSKLVDLYIKNKRLSRNLHFSLQSGSSTVLKRMNRNPDLNNFVKHLQEMKNKDSKFVYGADIIVGFPGESKKEFGETVRLIKQIKLNRAHMFRFSQRPGTIAYQKIQNSEWQDIPLEVKKEREKIIDSFLPGD